MELTARAGVEVFFSYSRRDRDLREELDRHLALLKRSGEISVWHDRQIGAGTEWAGAINEHLERAQVVLLLVSADFLNSDYCYDIELRRAMERHREGTAVVVPVLLRAADWEASPFASLQALPPGGTPVTSWANRDEAFRAVVKEIRRLVRQVRQPGAATGQRPDIEGDASPLRAVASQRHLIEEKTRTFVGRADVLSAFDTFVRAHPRGYFILTGGPGQGKSSVAARIAKERDAPFCFVGRIGAMSDPHAILSSLVTQVASRTAEPVRDGSVLPTRELAAALENVLRAAASKERIVVVVDGLNQIASGVADAPSFLPSDGLPDNVYFFVTSQPGDRVDELHEHLVGVPQRVHPLGPLSEAEATQMVRALWPEADAALAGRIARNGGGNPLYVRSTVEALRQDPRQLELGSMPPDVDALFRRETRSIRDGGIPKDVAGLISVSREALALGDLSEILGIPQRRVYGDGIRPIRQFLIPSPLAYDFYHEVFHHYLVTKLLYEDELRQYHRMIADWLMDSPSVTPYRRTSFLAHHLFHAGDMARFLATVDEPFLRGKVQSHGYGVLEDLELVARSLLEAGDPGVVRRCADLVDAVRGGLGDAAIDEIARRVRPNGVASARGHAAGRTVRLPPGLDIHAVVVPKGEVAADFVEVVRVGDRLVVGVGDAPGAGLKSAFVSRFIAAAFRRIVTSAPARSVGTVLREIAAMISQHQYFERVTMLCVDIDLGAATVSMANAGHPYPVLYSARRRAWDVLPVRGPILNDVARPAPEPFNYRVRHAELGPGDVLLLVSDGVTEGGRLDGNAYGYQFVEAVKRWTNSDARSITEDVMKGWRAHPREPDTVDDVAVVVVIATPTDLSRS